MAELKAESYARATATRLRRDGSKEGPVHAWPQPLYLAACMCATFFACVLALPSAPTRWFFAEDD